MMDDLLSIVVDPIYPPKGTPISKVPWPNLFPDCQSKNEFELIYSDGVQASKTAKIVGYVNQRRPYSLSVYPVK